MAGQVLRIVVGLKKMNDEAAKKQVSAKSLFVPSSIGISLLIGFFAGVLAIISLSSFKPDFFNDQNAKQVMIAIITAGYAGTDFIEGFISKYLPTANTVDAQDIPDAYKNPQAVTPVVPTPAVPGPGGSPQN